eukprot:846751-Rhodomonas_salina.1
MLGRRGDEAGGCRTRAMVESFELLCDDAMEFIAWYVASSPNDRYAHASSLPLVSSCLFPTFLHATRRIRLFLASLL